MTSAPPTPESLSFVASVARLADWVRRKPLEALLLAAILGGLLYFFAFYKVFNSGSQSTIRWALLAWNSENDLEYGWAIFPAAVYMAWWHREQLRAAPKSSSWGGLAVAIAGALLFVLAARSLQPRIALVSLPFLFYGGVRFLWGPQTARVVLFPCVFLLFMVPAGFLISRTVGLQTLAATVAAKLSSAIGIGVVADGTTLRALDGSFEYEVAGGCSGIRSLSAMTVLAAIYVHFTQKELWKKAALFAGSLLFALLGNFVRIFSVVLVARFVNPTLAGGLYHDYSGFIFFPIALGAMLGTAALLNGGWASKPASGGGPARTTAPAPAAKPANPISYDY